MENQQQPEAITTVQNSAVGSSWKGIVQVFYAPSQLFEFIKERPKVLVPWLVFFALILVFMVLAADLIAKLQLEIMQEKAAESGGVAGPMPSLEMMKYSTIIGGTIVMMLSPLIAAGLAYFFGSFIMAGKATFKQLLSVMLYGEIIFALGAIVLAPLMLAKQSLRVSLSLAAFFKNLAIDNPWYLAASKIGVFYIWEIIVIGIGLSIIYGFPRNKGYLLAVLSMGMISVLHVLSQFIFG
ncbi:MAG TPA: YIP1 family protein [candidate division Zixibacteria bacterium]|nr:YIP1 family protein [candidate division Zixibacteria bacterium]